MHTREPPFSITQDTTLAVAVAEVVQDMEAVDARDAVYTVVAVELETATKVSAPIAILTAIHRCMQEAETC